MKRKVNSRVGKRIVRIKKVTSMLQLGVLLSMGFTHTVFKKVMSGKILDMEELSHLAWAPERLDYLSTLQLVGTIFILCLAVVSVILLSERKERLIKEALKG